MEFTAAGINQSMTGIIEEKCIRRFSCGLNDRIEHVVGCYWIFHDRAISGRQSPDAVGAKRLSERWQVVTHRAKLTQRSIMGNSN